MINDSAVEVLPVTDSKKIVYFPAAIKMSDSLVLVQLKANRNTATRQFSRLANNVLRMYTVMSEEELKDTFKTLIIEANKVFEANDDVEDQYVVESQREGGVLSEQQRADLEKTKSECENRLDELKDLIMSTLWAKYGEEELNMVVETAESEAERVGAIQPNEDEEGYDFMVKHLGTLVGRAKALHTKWKCWAPSTVQKNLQSRVSDLERALLKLTARKAQFIQVRVKDRLSSTTTDSATPAIKMNATSLAKFPGTKCDFQLWKKDWKQQQERGAREVKKRQLLDSIDDGTLRDLHLSTCNTADDIFRVLDNHFGNKTSIAIEIVEKLQKLPPVVSNNPRKVIELIKAVEKASLELSNLGETAALKNPLVIKSIEGKLSEAMKKEWLLYAAENGDQQDQRFDILLTFLRSQKYIYEQLRDTDSDSKQNGTTMSSSLSPGCVVCGDSKHSQKLYFCKQFQVLKLTEKKDAVEKLGACVKCLELHSGHDHCKEDFFCRRPECSRNKAHHFLLCPRPAPKNRVIAVGGDNHRSYIHAQKEFVKLHPESRRVFSNSVTRTSHATNNQSAGGEGFEVVTRHRDASQGNSQRWVKDWHAQRPTFRFKSHQSQSSQKPQK
ncbi:uncharacterized protein [Eucyclogobius newberryi]|uniref:uncharacterized protein n=1 Tax=Eucyclogobius newberryi TaxID=166745 RepID=UPI003B5BD772